MKYFLIISLFVLSLGAAWPNSPRPTQLEQNATPTLESTLETFTLATKERKTIYTKRAHFEAPNWSRDGQHLVFNQAGRLYKLPVTGGEPQQINTGFALRCTNNHGFSPDGKWLALSDQSQEQRRSLIYVVPSAGGMPRRLTQQAPAYWHGWSPDGKTLLYSAERNGEQNVFALPFTGGSEKQLTTAAGIDDGPTYSPDGQYIYFSSVRTGQSHIWRMRADGSDQTQLTKDEFNNWFPHPSPDGKWLVLLSYAKDIKGHPANQEVTLRLLPLSGGEPQTLVKLFGGEGTLNAPSWSPDGQHFAFVSYRLIEP